MGIVKKNVLAIITEEELEAMKDLGLEALAIAEMQDNLTTQMRVVIKAKKTWWKEIGEKYNLESPLSLDEETREITAYKG